MLIAQIWTRRASTRCQLLSLTIVWQYNHPTGESRRLQLCDRDHVLLDLDCKIRNSSVACLFRQPSLIPGEIAHWSHIFNAAADWSFCVPSTRRDFCRDPSYHHFCESSPANRVSANLADSQTYPLHHDKTHTKMQVDEGSFLQH